MVVQNKHNYIFFKSYDFQCFIKLPKQRSFFKNKNKTITTIQIKHFNKQQVLQDTFEDKISENKIIKAQLISRYLPNMRYLK